MLKEKLKDYHIILASGSPRRQHYFKELGLDFEIRLKPIQESYPKYLKDSEITDHIVKQKAAVFTNLLDNDILITSDTIVWLNGEALGKPVSEDEAKEMISRLSGTIHEVITSVCFKQKTTLKVFNYTTKVTFRSLSKEAIDYYVDTFKPMDKAGAYGIQEWIGLIGIEKIEGSYANVVGMPMHMVYEELLALANDTV